MPRLILLNGAPASGKSTLARRFAAEHAHVTVIELDRLMAEQAGPPGDVVTAGNAARALALAHAGQLLAAGSHVLFPQYLGRTRFVEELQALADRSGARFVELALAVDPDVAVARFTARTAVGDDPLHHQAAAIAAASGGLDSVRDACARVLAVAAARPGTVVIDSTDPEQTYRRLREVLEDPTSSSPSGLRR